LFLEKDREKDQKEKKETSLDTMLIVWSVELLKEVKEN